MKQLNLSAIISAIIISLSIVMSAFIVHGSQLSEVELNKQSALQKEFKPLMTIKETAEYLNISEEEVKKIIINEDMELRNGGKSGKLFPVIRVGAENYISTDGLEEWMRDSSILRKQY